MAITFPFDPLERSAEMEALVMRGSRRLYYRFRPAPYYGGIATADAVGCSFLCAYCWNYGRNLNPTRFKEFYSPEKVASKLLHIARRKFYDQFRISGAEPILGERSFYHLVEVIKLIFQKTARSMFILETNGFFLGQRIDLAKKLNFPNLLVRVCLKGVNPETFESITGVKKEFFESPIAAVKALRRQGIQAWPALMRDLFSEEQISTLQELLKSREIKTRLELESLEAYPFVVDNMNRRNIRFVL
ncbi:MAG: radical SAM protein [Candidatus Aminicenantes bacterium]|jgi:uncharacterized Fe-S cluster-containing radical SAM superfamily protein